MPRTTMDTVFFPPPANRAGSSNDLMSSASTPVKSQLISSGPAANADQLGEIHPVEGKGIEATGGWDAYEVWRRFIKDARDRRKHPDSN